MLFVVPRVGKLPTLFTFDPVYFAAWIPARGSAICLTLAAVDHIPPVPAQTCRGTEMIGRLQEESRKRNQNLDSND